MWNSANDIQVEKAIVDNEYGKMNAPKKGLTVNFSPKHNPQQDNSLLHLVRRSRQGEEQAMSELYEQFKTSIFNLAYGYTYNRAVAEDLLQDIFIKIFTHFPELNEEQAFKSWLYRVAVNTCLSYIRKNKRFLRQNVPLTEIEGTVEEKHNESSPNMINKSLEEAVHHLPSKLKSVFLLHDVQGHKHQEIAQIMNWTVGTSKSQLFKARLKLRKYLEKKQLI